MIIEAMVFLAFVIALAAVIVRIYEWRQKRLYGPYAGGRSDRRTD